LGKQLGGSTMPTPPTIQTLLLLILKATHTNWWTSLQDNAWQMHQNCALEKSWKSNCTTTVIKADKHGQVIFM